jgi:hypothetical protein
MENIQQKADFLRTRFTELLSGLDPDTPRKWGKMNVQQMIEHMSEYVRIASGKTPVENVTADDMLPRVQAFLESEKPFRENTPNVLMPDTPVPARHATKQEAIEELRGEIADFFAVYEQNPAKTALSPFFGILDFDHQVQILYKHSTHHLRQFGVEV